MKTYTSTPNQYGWFFVINLLKDGTIKIKKRCKNKKYKHHYEDFTIYGDGAKLLRIILKEEFGEKLI